MGADPSTKHRRRSDQRIALLENYMPLAEDIPIFPGADYIARRHTTSGDSWLSSYSTSSREGALLGHGLLAIWASDFPDAIF